MFLWHVAVFEAALSGPYNLGANDLSVAEIELCTGLLDLCPFEPWRFPGPMSRLVGRGPGSAHVREPSRQCRGDRREPLGAFRGRPYAGGPRPGGRDRCGMGLRFTPGPRLRPH
jgi:hypothetical protein